MQFRDNPTTRQVGYRAPDEEIAKLFNDFGQRKPMGQGATELTRPHYFLLRRYLSNLDLLVILNTKRCRYRCKFCNLPAKSSATPIPTDAIIDQFVYVCREMKHALSVIDQITLSNEGSVLDLDTLSLTALEGIVRSAACIRSARKLVLETRLEFVDVEILRHLEAIAPRLAINVLTGFETLDDRIRRKFLVKCETIQRFEQGLDRIAEARVHLTCYVLLKPDPMMSDEAAVREADASIAYLEKQTRLRGTPLTIRLNPMYAAEGTPWAAMASKAGRFVPPRLSDALSVAKRAQDRGVEVYLGLSAESLATSDGTYMAREDFSRDLLREAKRFNDIRGKAVRT